MGIHTGEPAVGDEGYLGLDVVRAARICSAGHGGQILLSETTRALLGNELPDGVAVVDLGQQHLKDVQHERIYQLAIDGDQQLPAAEDGDTEERLRRARRPDRAPCRADDREVVQPGEARDKSKAPGRHAPAHGRTA